MRPDLHVHTSYSDGSYTPVQVVALAAQAGLPAVAICDHDECRAYGKVKDANGIMVIPGIELGAAYESSVHVLGLLIDWQDSGLMHYIEKAAADRQQRAQAMLRLFEKEGVPLTMADVQAECEGCVIGRPHFAAALFKKGLVSSPKEAFVRYLKRNACCYVPLEKIDAAHAAELILGAGGKPVLAHPGLVSQRMLDVLMPQLRDMGFWGVEAYHSAHSNGQCTAFESMARQYGLYVTCGSDFHGSAKPKIQIGQEQRGGVYLTKSLEVLFADMKW